jgi:hypothetical protein
MASAPDSRVDPQLATVNRRFQDSNNFHKKAIDTLRRLRTGVEEFSWRVVRLWPLLLYFVQTFQG